MAFCANDCTPGGVHSLSFTPFIIMGMYPLFISNGTSPIALLMLELIVNSINGLFSTQSLWSGSITALNICPMDLLALSIIPAVCGWNDIDMSNFVPIILCNSCHHFDVNFGSQLDTIDDGSPCSLTTSLIYIDDNWVAVVFVFIGIKCTIDDNLHITIHR
jgi:hypothetical protein